MERAPGKCHGAMDSTLGGGGGMRATVTELSKLAASNVATTEGHGVLLRELQVTDVRGARRRRRAA